MHTFDLLNTIEVNAIMFSEKYAFFIWSFCIYLHSLRLRFIAGKRASLVKRKLVSEGKIDRASTMGNL